MPARKVVRFRRYSAWLKEKFGFPVRKIPLDGGFTCPNRDGTRGEGGCVYCSNPAFSPVAGTALAVPEQLEAGLSRAGGESRLFIAYFQPYSGTYAPVARLRELFEPVLRRKGIVGLAVGTRPDCLPPDVCAYLEELSRRTFLTVELGVQTLDEEILKSLNRGHTAAETRAAGARLRAAGIPWVAHLILGLPGETAATTASTARGLRLLKPDGVKLHQLMIVRGTPMAELWRRGEARALELEEYASLLGLFLRSLGPGPLVHRLLGDCRPEAGLLAPEWSARKSASLSRIDSLLLREGVEITNSPLSAADSCCI